MGAMGKSAQLGAAYLAARCDGGANAGFCFIHAATMVTAGVFLVARFSPLFEYAPDALMVVTLVGATTAFVAATIGLTQFDIKRVIAYSTMSQLRLYVLCTWRVGLWRGDVPSCDARVL